MSSVSDLDPAGTDLVESGLVESGLAESGLAESGRAESDLPGPFVAWVRRFGLEGLIRGPLLRTVRVWADYCSPPGASEAAMSTAYADLALWFFYLDDYEGQDFELLFDACAQILDRADVGEPLLDGAQPTLESSESAPPGLLPAFADVVTQIQAHGEARATRYIQSRRDSLDKIRARIRVSRDPHCPAFDYRAYYDLRMVSVYVHQWVVLWEIVGGFCLDEGQRALPEVTEARRAVTAWHILQNDMRSVERDMRAGSPNLVLLHAEHEAPDIHASVAEIRGLFDEELENFRAAQATVAASGAEGGWPDGAMRRYFELLEICLTGGERSFWEISERYDWAALEALLEQGEPAATALSAAGAQAEA